MLIVAAIMQMKYTEMHEYTSTVLVYFVPPALIIAYICANYVEYT